MLALPPVLASTGSAWGINYESSPFCGTKDRDAFIEELAEEIWEERHAGSNTATWAQADPRAQAEYRKLAADTLRFLEHGHG